MDFVDRIRGLVRVGAVRTSDHAYGRLQQKDISYRMLVASLGSAEVLERYPDYRHGPCASWPAIWLGRQDRSCRMGPAA